jgi:subtilisin family serine protease
MNIKNIKVSVSKPKGSKFSFLGMLMFALTFAAVGTYVVYSSFAGNGDDISQSELPVISGEYAPNQILVRFKPGTKPEKEKEIKDKNGLEQIDEIKQIETRILKIKDGGNVAAKKKALSKNKHVLYAEPNYVRKANITPNDPYWANQQKYMGSISAPTGWDITTGSNSQVIAILDTGVNMTHPDLKGRFVQGWDCANADNDPSDDHGHGTFVAGAAAATGNNIEGIAGVNWGARIMPVKVLGSNGASVGSCVTKGIIWAADNGAQVINMSLGGLTYLESQKSACDYAISKGVVVVASAGNGGVSPVEYPAAYSSVVAVGGLSTSDTIASWSAYGPELELTAPGSWVQTTNKDGLYSYASGTSIAAPFVAGLSALVMSQQQSPLSNTQIRDIMKSTATDMGDPGFDIHYGYGRINMEAALKKANGGTVTPPQVDTTAPVVSIVSPVAGSTLTGVSDVTVNAVDNTAVSKVELYVDGKMYASTTVSPYIFSLDTSPLSNSNHTISAKAYDTANNIGVSGTITVAIKNVTAIPEDDILPTVSITSPIDGAIISKKATINVSASDNIGVAKVEIYINNKLYATLTSFPYTKNWNVGGKNVPKGENIITAYAYDAAGNVATTSIKVTK